MDFELPPTRRNSGTIAFKHSSLQTSHLSTMKTHQKYLLAAIALIALTAFLIRSQRGMRERHFHSVSPTPAEPTQPEKRNSAHADWVMFRSLGEEAQERHAMMGSLEPRKPLAKNPPTVPHRGEKHQIVVKFRDHARARATESGRLSLLSGAVRDEIAKVAEKYALRFNPVYTGEEADAMAELELDAARNSGKAQPDFLGMMIADTGTTDPNANLEIAQALHALDITEFVNIHALDAASPPPPANPGVGTPDHAANQEWRGPNPGLDVMRAWGSNGKGQGVRLAVVEYGFNPDHEEFIGANITHNMRPNNPADAHEVGHGSMTLGVIAAQENGYGVDGIAPDAEIHFYSEYEYSAPNIAIRRGLTISLAAQDLEAGDIMLLEMQTDEGYQPNKWGPAELQEEVFIATKAATDKGITVVSTAGNGGVDLDSPEYSSYMAMGSSGAILVGSGTPDLGHYKNPDSTYGSRVDVHSWGSNVLTAGGDGGASSNGLDIDQNYSYYTGTSSAGALVAGMCASWQSMQFASTGRKLTPNQLRSQIRNRGYEQGDPERGNVGRFVSLAKICDQLDGRPQSINFGQSRTYGFATLPVRANGWQFSAEPGKGRIQSSSDALLMDRTTFISPPALNTATLHLNLEGKGNAIVSFRHTDVRDEFTQLEGNSYTGSADVDGVFISADGVTWHKVQLGALEDGGDNRRQYTFSLDSAARTAGIRFNDNFRVRFQCYSSGFHRGGLLGTFFRPNGRSFDDVSVRIGNNGMLEFADDKTYISERAGEARFRVERKNGTVGSVMAQYFVNPRTATAGEDYVAPITGVVSFAPGETQKEFTIVINDDDIVEGIETFTVRLDRPRNGAYIGGKFSNTVKIADNDFEDGSANGYRFQDRVPNLALPRSEDSPVPGQNYLELSRGVTDVPGMITDVKVNIYDFWHGKGNDLHMLLKSPSGVGVMLMSDAGGEQGFFLSSLRFGANGEPLPENSQLQSDTIYQPANYPPGLEPLPPQAGYANPDLSVLNGTDPNGDWKLFIVDDSDNGKTGFLAGGWELIIQTDAGGEPARTIDSIRLVGANQETVELNVTAPENEPTLIISSPSLPFTEAYDVEAEFIGTGSLQTIQFPRRPGETSRFFQIGSAL